MSAQHLALLSVAVALAAFLQGSIGVGFALLMSPLLSLLEPALLPVGVLVLMLPLNCYVAWRERQRIDFRGASWITAGRVVGTAGGVWVLAALSASALNIFVGLAILAAVLVTLAMPRFDPGRTSFVAAGLVTGVTETATGVGGPPLALVYQHQLPSVMRPTIAACFLVGELVSLLVLVVSGSTSALHLLSSLQLMPALLVGMLASRFMHHRINAGVMRGFVLAFSSAAAVLLLAKS